MSDKHSDRDILSVLEAKDSANLILWLNDGSLSPVWCDAAGNSLLHYAASWGHAPFADALLEKGGSVSAVNSGNETPEDVARVFGWDKLAARFQALAKKEREVSPPDFPFQSLDEIRQAFLSTGLHPVETAIRAGQFGRVVDLALKDPVGFTASDFLTPTAGGETLLMKLCRAGQLPALMKPELWARRPAEFQTLWDEVPEHFRAGVDYNAVVNALHRSRLQTRHRPKLDKGP